MTLLKKTRTKLSSIWTVIKNSPALQYFLVFVLFSLLIFFIIKDSPGALCPDSFYHAKVAQTIWETKSLITDFPWLQFTVLGGQSYVDHHMIFHLIIAPFIGLFGFFGFKVVIPLLGGSLFLLIFYILKKWGVKYPLIWTLILLAIPGFIFRIILYRAISLSIIFLLLTFYFTKEKKSFLLLITSFLFVWTYDAFPLAILIGFIFLISEKIISKRWRVKSLACILSGITAGIIINPYFPQNIAFYKTHLFAIPFSNGTNPNLVVGAEWYPTSIETLIKSLTIPWLLFSLLLALLLYFSKKQFHKIKAESLAASITAILFFLMMLKSQRFSEYWVPFTILATTLTAKDLNITSYFKKVSVRCKKWILKAFYALGITMLSFFFIFMFLESKLSADNTNSYTRYEKAALWLSKNTPKNSTITNVGWDDFPELFYWDDQNNYVSGMDMMFLCNKNKKTCSIYNEVAQGKSLEKIKNMFSSDILFVSKKNKNYNQFNASNKLSPVYSDQYALIFKIK